MKGYYIVEIVEGELYHSGPMEPFSTDLLKAHVLQDQLAQEIVPVRLPRHPCPVTEVAAFAPGDESRWEPNVFVPGREEPIYGPVAIAGRGTERFRYLTFAEAGVYRLEHREDEEYPRLVVGDWPS